MKKITLIILVISGFAFLSAVMKDDGRAGATGSPGETTCNTTQCHNTFALNSGGGSVVISAPTMAGWEYIPGQVYPISVTVAKAGVSLFGLGFEALRSTGANAGTLAITNAAQTQIKNAVVGGNVRNNVVHQLNGGSSADSHTFTFNWTAPGTGTGNITFYTAGNAANGNTTTSGDYIYTASQIVTEFTSGINDPSEIYSLKLFPVPANDKFQISFNLFHPEIVAVKLFDIQGKHVADITSGNYNPGDHLLSYEINSEIPDGIYFVNVSISNKQLIKKIVILK